jgi:hypothetical protein
MHRPREAVPLLAGELHGLRSRVGCGRDAEPAAAGVVAVGGEAEGERPDHDRLGVIASHVFFFSVWRCSIRRWT